jgi:short-subunit dehydrogenase
MRVGLTARTRAELDETASGMAESLVVPADVGDSGQVADMFEAVEARLGPVDVLVNSAGIYHHGLAVDLDDRSIDSVLRVNLQGTIFTCRRVLPSMIARESGYIVNIASIAGKVGTARRALYSASKFGVVGFTQSLAEEIREYGIRASVVCPGSTNTRFSPKETEGKRRDLMLQPEDVAHAVGMLVTQEPNSFISEVVMRPTRVPGGRK